VVTLAVNRCDWPGALIGGLALMAGTLTEATVVTARALLVMRAGFRSRDETRPSVCNLSALARFYFPLAATSILTVVTWPLIAAGISRAAKPASSLAAWPVALSILWLLTTPIQMLQQVAITQGSHRGSVKAVAGFGLIVGLSATLLMGTFAFSPLIQFFLREVVVTPSDVTPLVVWTVRILTLLPVIVAGQSLLQGFLIGRGATADVQLAMAVNLVVLGLLLSAGITYGRLPGAPLSAGAMASGLLAETAVLWWRTKSRA